MIRGGETRDPIHFAANMPTVSRAGFFDHSLEVNRIVLSREFEETALLNP